METRSVNDNLLALRKNTLDLHKYVEDICAKSKAGELAFADIPLIMKNVNIYFAEMVAKYKMMNASKRHHGVIIRKKSIKFVINPYLSKDELITKIRLMLSKSDFQSHGFYNVNTREIILKTIRNQRKYDFYDNNIFIAGIKNSYSLVHTLRELDLCDVKPLNKATYAVHIYDRTSENGRVIYISKRIKNLKNHVEERDFNDYYYIIDVPVDRDMLYIHCGSEVFYSDYDDEFVEEYTELVWDQVNYFGIY